MRRTLLALLVVSALGVTGMARAAAVAPTMTVTPSTGLHEGQQVTLDFSGFSPGTSVLYAQCRAGAISTSSCDISHFGSVSVGSDGTATATYVVHLALNLGGGTPVDCQASAGACTMGAEQNNGSGGTVQVPLSFVAPGTARRGDVTITPATVVDGNDATIATTSATTDAALSVAVCAATPHATTDCTSPLGVGTDSNGAAALSRFMTASERTLSGATLDCTTSGSCVAAMWDVRDFAGTLAVAPYVVVRQTTGTFEVTPATDLVDGQVVRVTGAGWSPGAALVVGECRHGATDPSGCNASSARFFTAANDGTFALAYAVSESSITNCGAQRFACDLIVAGAGLVFLARVPIAFAANVVAVTASYGPRQYALITQAATQLNLSLAELQRLGTLQEAARLGATGVAPSTGGSTHVTTVWCVTQRDALAAVAQRHGLTLEQLQVIGTMRLARHVVGS